MKTAITDSKFLKYVFLASPALIVAGLTAGLIGGAWGVIPLSLLVLGVAIAIVWLLTQSNSIPAFLGRRSTQASTNALVSTLAVLVILGLVNFLGVRYAQRIDLTDNQQFTLSPQTVDVAKGLTQPMQVVIFDTAPNPQDEALLDNYQRETQNLTYEYVDPQREPGRAREFGVQTVGEVYLQQGTQRRLVQTVNAEERLSERKLTNALVQMSGATPVKVAVVQGHGERPLEPGQGSMAQAIARLKDESYTPEPLGLVQSPAIAADTDVVIVAGPKRPLLEAEVNALRTYLTKKSGVLLMLDPQVDSGLTPLLSEWGLTLAPDRLVVDPAGQAAGLGLAVPIVTQYGGHPITQEFGNGISFFPAAQPIAIAEKEGITATPLLITSEDTTAQQIDASGQLITDPATDPKGPLVIGVALSKSLEGTAPQTSPSPSPSAEDAAKPEARLVVIGNSGFITDSLFGQQLNGDVFLNSVAWLKQGDDETLSIRPKEQTNRRLLLSGQKQLLISLLALVVLPIVAFGLAFGLWWSRR